MRILVAHLYHESNTFCVKPTRKEEFEVYRGQAVIDNLAGCKALTEAGAEIVPTLYVSRWSSGTVAEDAYLAFEEEILDHVRREKDTIDGIYLSLHGGMTVENIGSGEYRVLSDVRAIVGDEMPISVSLDMHANNRTGLETLANVITGYHTAPHEDVEETQLSAARALVEMVNTGLRPHPEMVRVPMLLVGERAITSMEPLKTIFDRCAELEADPRIHAATLFVGMAWGDTPNTTVTTMVCPKSPEFAAFARQEAIALGQYLLDRRDTCPYAHPSYPQEEAVDKALASENSPLLLSDSGDNPTAGGVGCNTVLLRLIKGKNPAKKVLFAPIYDENVVRALQGTPLGTRCTVSIGMQQDADSAPVGIDCEVIRFGEIYAYHEIVYEKKADYVFLRSGNIDIVVADHQLSFTGMECFETAGVKIADYDIVVIKMGYVMPELRPYCKEMIMALTPGRTPLTIRAEQYHNLPRPIWPLDELDEGVSLC